MSTFMHHDVPTPQARVDASPEIVLTGGDVTIEQVVDVARGRAERIDGRFPRVAVDAACAQRLFEVRQKIERDIRNDSAPTYGVSTGVGVLKNRTLAAEELNEHNAAYIRSHCVGVGPFLPEETVRAAVFLRANSFVGNRSGVRPVLVEGLVALLNAGIVPAVRKTGSLGASGDLAGLSEIGAVLLGEEHAQAFYRAELMPAARALSLAGLRPPVPLGAKEAMALTNGATISLAAAVLGYVDSESLTAAATIAAALSVEAMRGDTRAFDARIHAARGYAGQQEVARCLNGLLAGSARATGAARAEWLGAGDSTEPRVQDAYSLRCIPQVHGAVVDYLGFMKTMIAADLNAATDNPLVFQEQSGDLTWLSGGNFFGSHVAFAADMMKPPLVKLAQISERRTFRLLNPLLSFGLPEQLTGAKAGVHTGLSIANYTQNAVLSEMLVLSTPASIHTAVTSGGQEDIASMAMTAVMNLREVVDKCAYVIGIELLCAAQGISLTQGKLVHNRLGTGTRRAYQAIRSVVDPVAADRYLVDDIEAVTCLVRSGQLCRAVASGR